MRCDVEARDDVVIIRPVGEIDLSTAGDFSSTTDRLLAEGFKHLVLDLRQLTFMDSSGLRAVVKLHSDAARLEIVEGPDHVQRLFTITGLRRILLFATAAEALGEP
jgi:anti-anti-sigma factor